MFVCICNAVTDREIRAHAGSGVTTLEELRRVTGCGDCCGQCTDEAEALLFGAAGPMGYLPALPIQQGA